MESFWNPRWFYTMVLFFFCFFFINHFHRIVNTMKPITVNPLFCRLSDTEFPLRLLPSVQDTGSQAGTLQEVWYNMNEGTPVGVAMGDLQCSIISRLNPGDAGMLHNKKFSTDVAQDLEMCDKKKSVNIKSGGRNCMQTNQKKTIWIAAEVPRHPLGSGTVLVGIWCLLSVFFFYSFFVFLHKSPIHVFI